VQVIPVLARAFKEYGVAKIASRINKGTCQRINTSCKGKAIVIQCPSH
jgi:hypothetical protein